MSDKSELTDEEFESDSMGNPIRQNHDYGGNFLDKVRNRLERRKQRKDAMSKFAQQQPSKGDTVRIMSGNHRGMRGVIDEISSSKYMINMVISGREVTVDIDRTETLEIMADSRTDDYKIGDQVLVSREEGYDPLPAVVNSESISNPHDATEKLYVVRFQYDGKWYNKQVSERRLQPNPGGNVSLGETDAVLEGSESTEDPALVPVYSDRHGYFIFPKYENDLYPKHNDILVRDLNDKYVSGIAKSLARLKDYDVIPVIENAAVFALLNKNPGELISRELYDYIKSNYPKHFHDAITAEVINSRRLWAIPEEKREDVYDMYTEPILQTIFSYKDRAFYNLFMPNGRHPGGVGGDYKFLLDRLLEGNAPEFKEALRTNIDMLSSAFILKAHIYTVLPEESKEKVLKHLEFWGRQQPDEVLLVSNYFPEALELLGKNLESDFQRIFSKSSQDFVERLSPEKRQALYPRLLENDPEDIFHAIRFAGAEDRFSPAKSREAASQIVKEVPQNIWNQLALKCIKTAPEYFFTVEAPKFVEFSEEVLKVGYDYLMDNLPETQRTLKGIFKSESFNELLKKYGISEERFLSIIKNMDGKFLEQCPALYETLVVVSGKLASKINENQELSEKEGIFIRRYFEDELFLAGPQSPQTINAFLETEHPVNWSKAPTRRSLGNANAVALFETIHKAEEPFLSEKAFRNLLEVADNKNVISNNYGPSKPFVDWMPMTKMIGEPSEELLRVYAEKLVTEKPEQLFRSSGLEKIKTREYVSSNNMDDEALIEEVYGFHKEDLDGSEEEVNKAIKNLADKIREGASQQKASGAMPLIVRFPDLLPPAIQNFNMEPGFISLRLGIYLKMVFPEGNIPLEVADAILNRMYQSNQAVSIIIDPSEYKIMQKLRELHPDRYDKAIRSSARLHPAAFLNSEFGKDRAKYNDEIFAAIKDLNIGSFGTYGDQNDYLSEETISFFLQNGNEDIMKAVMDRAVEIDRLEDLIHRAPGFAEKAREEGMRILPIASLRGIEDLETAKNTFAVTRNDLPIENLPDEIRISRSIYQTQQRAYTLEEYTRYTISNNNVDPTPPLYDIGKQLVHAGDGVAHSNVGASGFTNSWALVSFAEVDSEESIIIEQYQSDYPPVLFHLFGGQEYGTGKDALQRLIRRYGDQEAINQYVAEKIGDAFTYSQEQLDRSLDQFDWSPRTAHNLNRAGFTVVEQLVQRSKNDLLQTGLFGKRSVNEIEEVLQENGLSLRGEDQSSKTPIDEDDIELPIKLAPAVKDARTHFEYISKAYPYLAIINTIKVAQNQQMNYIYIDREAAGRARIGNKDKARKLYQEIPAAIGDEYHDENHKLNLWKIPATDAAIEVLNSMIQEETGKDADYDFSRTPAQNQELRDKKLQEQRKKKQQWSATPEKQEKLNEIERSIRELLPIETPNFYSPQQALRFLGQEVKGKVVPKKRFNSQFGRIMRDLGMLARASRRQKRMIKIASLYRLITANTNN